VPFEGDYTGYGKLLDPSINGKQVKEAIEALTNMKLIQKNKSGRLLPVDNAISTGNELKSIHLAKFQMVTMDFAKRAIENIPAKERDISVLSLSLSSDNFHLIKNEIQHFRKRLAKLAVDDKSQHKLYQMNLQFFPVSQEYNQL